MEFFEDSKDDSHDNNVSYDSLKATRSKLKIKQLKIEGADNTSLL
jgi:hypothetical protein